MIVLPETALSGAVATAEKIRAILAQTPVNTSAGPLTVSASFGVAQLDSSTGAAKLSVEALLRRADEALYCSKLAGRNRVTLGNS